MNDILGLIDDPALVADLRRVAAAADRALHEASPPVPRRMWTDAAIVVLDRAAATVCAAEHPRRPGVVLVCSGPADLDEWQAAATVGAEHVLALPDDEVELLALVSAAGEPAAGSGVALTVVGGCGGAGASTFAAALAWTPGHDTLLVDADPFGGGLDVLTGLEERPGVRWSGVTVDGGRVSARALRDAAPAWRPGVGVLSTDREAADRLTPAAAGAVVEALKGAGTTVVCDVGRCFGPVAETVLALSDLTVVVTPARVGAALSAARVAGRLLERGDPAGLVVRGPAPGGLRAEDVADVVGLDLLASMRPEPGLAEMLERGGLRLRSRSPLAAAARDVLATLSTRLVPRRVA
ncbi:CpaE-like family protein [Rhodococcus sp. Z13]|uniref:CpaE-like family protein n=1 Tax=Rhodococcus sacchari TaxID=2962047 RepID=A0ACD4DH53_9NOCA|nr:septum site-determining protein Ssd [Rhodococcus sp. Z13]UYP19342.1 CpaE-like family protein [Rhodococcus sp. Z13]